jgi:gliding motility-associated-like protein
MVRFLLLLFFVFQFIGIKGQTIQSGMSWLTTNSATTSTSPNYPTTNCGKINYSINCSKPFKRTNNGAPYSNNCLIFPSDISISNTFLTMTITFNQPVNNLKIRFIDLDENVSGFSQPEESISQINPAPSSVTPLGGTINPIFLSGGIVTPFDNNPNFNNNDASGWVNWTGSLSSVSFRYNRPGELYGLIIDSIYFDCPSCVGDCDSEIEMPNVYSPNSDETNDQFVPITFKNIKSANLIIVNRWGNLIHEESNLFLGWDGTSNGKECTEGVYFWKIDYEDFNSTKFTSQGFLHLIR